MSLRPSLFAIPLPMPSHLKPSQGWFWSAGGWLQPTASSMLSVSTCKPSNTFLAYKYILTQRRTGIGMNEMREMICSSWGWLWFIENPLYSLTPYPSAFIILDSSPFFSQSQLPSPSLRRTYSSLAPVECRAAKEWGTGVNQVRKTHFFLKHALKWTLAFLLHLFCVSISVSLFSPALTHKAPLCLILSFTWSVMRIDSVILFCTNSIICCVFAHSHVTAADSKPDRERAGRGWREGWQRGRANQTSWPAYTQMSPAPTKVIKPSVSNTWSCYRHPRSKYQV